MIPPQIPTRRGMSCWTVGLLSCLGAVALLVIALAIMFIVLARRPEFQQVMSSGMQIAQCQQNMQEIYAAIERYRQRNGGQYPKDLNELAPRYLAEAGKLKCPADTTGKPVSYQYLRPQKDSPETSPLLQCDHHVVLNEKVPVIMLRNGQVLSASQARRRDGLSAPAREAP
ncbi:MAG: hypothetical protein NZ520_09090 [bacterium]|nr:hypothetical protein [bacterium]